MSLEFDYIVCGAGSGGCVVANRLSKDHTVLLLEAGPHATRWMVTVPCVFFDHFQGAAVNKDDIIDWHYHTQPEPGLKNRQILIERARCLGGCSSHNGMVYMRPHPEDLDCWAEMTGDSDWSFDNALPFFLKSEGHLTRKDDPYHGTEGELKVRQSPLPEFYRKPLEMVEKAAVASGFKISHDNNGKDGYDGFHTIEHTIDENGFRCDTYTAFIEPIKSRESLTVKTEVYIDKLTFDGKQATGVVCTIDGKETIFKAKKEIILSAGAIGSPCILQRSGVGNQEFLKKLEIDVVHHLPGVGGNLMDHPRSGVDVLTNDGFGLGKVVASMEKDFAAAGDVMSLSDSKARQILRKHGMVPESAAPHNGFIRSSPSEPRPDIQVYFYYGNSGNSVSINNVDLTAFKYENIASFLVVLQRPVSRGHLEIASKNHMDAPKIYNNFLNDPEGLDCERLRKGCQIALDLLRHPEMAELFKTQLNPASGDVTEEYVRGSAGHLYHSSGTCRMGKSEGDEGAVCDSHGRVLGIQGLRVADASLMPVIVACNTNAPTIMIAEKIADYVLKGQ